MSEILTQSNQRIVFRLDGESNTESQTDYAASVFHGSGSTYKLYDNPAFWGPIKPMGIEVFFRTSWLGTEPFEGDVEFRLCNRPDRSEGVFFKIRRILNEAPGGAYHNLHASYPPPANGYANTWQADGWYGHTPEIVLSGGEFTEPLDHGHAVSCSSNNTERTLLEYGIIGQTPQIRDISLLRGAYWIRMGVFQEPEISGQKQAYSSLQIVTDTEHLELLELPTFTFCNSETKIPSTYGEMRFTASIDHIKESLLGYSYANRYTVGFDSGEVGRKPDKDVYLRQNGYADNSTNWNPATFRHNWPTNDPYATDARHANADCGELHGNWLTIGAAKRDSRQSHQHGSSGCKTTGQPTHTPSFEAEKTKLKVSLNLNTKNTFLNWNQYFVGDLNAQGVIHADESSEIINQDKDISPLPEEVNTYIVHEPCKTLTIKDLVDKDKWSIVYIHFQALEPQQYPYLPTTVSVNYGSGVAEITNRSYETQLMLVWDPTVEKWSPTDFATNILYAAPIAYRLDEFECENTMGGEQLAPYGFYGTKDGEELEDDTRISFPVWRPYQGYGSEYFSRVSEFNYEARDTSWVRATEVVAIGTQFTGEPNFFTYTIETQAITRSMSFDSLFASVVDAAEEYMDGTSVFSELSAPVINGTFTQEWSVRTIYPEGYEGTADSWHPEPNQPEPERRVFAYHSYGWREHTVTERVSQWWQLTTQYDVDEGQYPINADENGDQSGSMLSGNLDVEKEGGEAWPNYQASEERLRLDGVLQFTVRRYRDNFKRYGISAATKSWSDDRVTICSATSPATRVYDLNAEPPVEGAYPRPAAGSLANPHYYWFINRPYTISREAILYWPETPWNSSPAEISDNTTILMTDAEREAGYTKLDSVTTQAFCEDITEPVTVQRTFVSFRVRAYLSKEESDRLKNGEEVELDCKVWRGTDEYTGGRNNVFSPNLNKALFAYGSSGGNEYNKNFAFRLGSDGFSFENPSGVGDQALDGCKIILSMT